MQFDTIKLNKANGIADKTPFSRLMCETLALDKPDRLLDIGCGSGVVGLYCLLNGSKFVHFNDVLPAAIDLTLGNITQYQIERSRYQLIIAPFQNFNFNLHTVDAIAFNPPQLPTDLVDIEQFQEKSERIFRDGGATGRSLIDLYVNWLAENMPKHSKAYLGMSSMLMIDDLIEQAAKLGLSTLKKHHKIVPLRKIFNTAVINMSAMERKKREITEDSGDFYKKIYGLQFSHN